MGKMSAPTDGCCSFDPDDQLVFRFEPNKHIRVTLQMKNNTDKNVAFKVKTTNPKKYCVKPSSGIVSGKVSRDIIVTLNAQKTTPVNLQNCRDKFLIQTAVVPSAGVPVTSQLFEKADQKGELQQTKLRVQMIPPAQPPSPVPEEVSKMDESDVRMGTPVSIGPRVTFADQQQVHKVQQQQVEAVKTGGFGMLYVLCVALMAFLLGYFSRGNIAALEMLKTAIAKILWGSAKQTGFLNFFPR